MPPTRTNDPVASVDRPVRSNGDTDRPKSRAARRPDEPPAEGSRLDHLRALDGLRGIAVLAVVLFHFSPELAPGGFLGVDVFFVLSGFLITSLLVSEWESTAAISLRQFWTRRARRLLPALFLLLAAVGLYALFVATELAGHRMAEDGLFTFGYLANWHFIASGQAYVEQFVRQVPSPLRHTWSLAIEEQFYLLWPLVVLGISKLVGRSTSGKVRRRTRDERRLRRVLAVVCVVVASASLALMILMFNERDPNRVYYGTDTRAFLLLLGAAIGAVTAGRPQITQLAPRRLLVVAGVAATIVLTVCMATVETTDTWLYQGGYGIIAVLIAVVLIAAAQPGMNPLSRIFEGRALVGLGLISYGVYLWHWPVTVWLTEAETGLRGAALFAFRAVVTLMVSLASYWLIEQPIRRGRLPEWRPIYKRVATVIAIAGVAALLVVPVVAFASVEAPPKVAPTKSSEATTTTYATVARCDGALPYSPPITLTGLPPAAEVADRHPRVQLVGNSVAVELVPCLAKLVEAHGGAFETVSHSAAPPCALLPELRKQMANPDTVPDVAIWFAFDWYNDPTVPCASDWLLQVREAMQMWRDAGAHIYLVPIVPTVVPSRDPRIFEVRGPEITVDAPAQTPEFTQLAAEDPEHVTLVDPGMFVRDANGAYQWRMPCLPDGEPGCAADGTVGVRYVDGFHLCTDPAWDGTHCVLIHSAGARRVAAAIASQIIELASSKAASSP